MNYKLFSALSFVAGAAIGSVVTWKLVKTKYEQIAQEEIESVKEVYSRKKTPPSIDECVDEIIRQTDDKPDVVEYAARIANLGYDHDETEKESKEIDKIDREEDEDSMRDKPYVISMEEYDESEYNAETLTLYADGVLTDWRDDIIDDVEDMVGQDAIDNFDKYADPDTVYVRNDARELDYEIQRDYRNYSDVYGDESAED